MKIVRRVLVTLILLPLVGLAAIVLLALTLDPNRLKPVLESTLAQHNIELDIQGDIRWRFYPNLGISLEDITLTALGEESRRPLASGATAGVSVQVMPLLRRQIMVDGIYLDGATVTYAVNAEGVSNWDAVAADPSTVDAPLPEPDDTGGQLPELAIRELQLQGLALRYINLQTDEQWELNNINLTSHDLALDGKTFPIELSLLAQYEGLPPMRVQYAGPVSIDLGKHTLNLNKGELRVSSGEANALLQLSSTTSWQPEVTSRGMLLLEPMKLKPWFEAFDIEVPPDMHGEALSQFGFSTPYDFGPDQFHLASVQVQLDSTELTGNLEVTDFEQPQITSHWRGTKLNLDHYLPPTEEEETEIEDSPPQPLPLEALRGLALDFSLGFEQIVIQQLPLLEPSLAITARDGLVTIDRLHSRLAGGEVSGTGQLDARPEMAQLTFNLEGQGVGLGQLLQTFADLDFLSGTASLAAVARSHGTTDQELMNNLVFEAEAQSQELRLTPFNLEQQFCRALAVLQQSTPPEFDWPELTRLEPVTLSIHFAQETLTLKEMRAEVAELEARAAGHLNLTSGVFDFPFSLSLGGFAGEIPGCLPIEDRWRQRALPLRCRGSVDAIGARTCLPDTELLTAILRGRVEGEVRERLEAEKEVLQERAEERARELRESERGQKVEERARGLLDQVRPRR